MLGDKAKKIVWYGAVTVFGAFMTFFAVTEQEPAWWQTGLAMAELIIGLLVGQPWKRPQPPDEPDAPETPEEE